MNPLLELNLSEAPKAKKVAYSLCTAILIVSTLELGSDHIEILGLEIGVNKFKILTLLKAFLIIQSIGLLSIMIKSYLSNITNIAELDLNDGRIRDEINMKIQMAREQGDYSDEFHGFNSEYEENEYDRAEKLKKAKATEAMALKYIDNMMPNIFLIFLIITSIFFNTKFSNIVYYMTDISAK